MMPRSLFIGLGLLAGSVATAVWMAAPSTIARAQELSIQGEKKKFSAEPKDTKELTADQAHLVGIAAVEKAASIDTKMNIAIVDAGGNLKAFMRMDGAWLGSIDIAIRKAKTARYFDMPTGELGKLSQPGGPLYNIEHSNGGLITFPGGVPIKAKDGTIIGAIGVSGSTVDKDHAVAEAGAAALDKK